MMTNDDKVKFQNILYIRNEYALKALLDSIVADGEFSEDDVKKFNDKIQTLTDDFIKKIDVMVLEKEKEIMKI